MDTYFRIEGIIIKIFFKSASPSQVLYLSIKCVMGGAVRDSKQKSQFRLQQKA
jgi:hypothetical protein